LKAVPTVEKIVDIIEGFAPISLAMPGDPTGLQCGDLHRKVSRMMLSLDAGLDAVHQAVSAKTDLLVTHHPILFEPLDTSNIGKPEKRALITVLREDLAVYSAHTNLDACASGINASLAGLLDLDGRKFLKGCGAGSYKVVAFVPPESLEEVRTAAFKAGGGRIGGYSDCSFSTEGEGTFYPGKGTSPVKGRPGRSEKVREVRLEISAFSENLGSILAALHRAHPYEVPVIDVYPSKGDSRAAGFGIAGMLKRSMTAGQVADRIGSVLKPGSPRLVGKRGRRVRKVAVCAGSGSSLLDAAVESGAQLFITGDVRYHEARKAEDAGISILDVGHFAPERFGFLKFGKLLDKELVRNGYAVELLFAREKDPFLPA